MNNQIKEIIARGAPRRVVLRLLGIDEDPVVGGGYYLAFGSNLSVDQMAGRVEDFVPAGRVLIVGQRLAFGWRKRPGKQNVATLVPDPGQLAAGAVYRMSQTDFERMDRNEGVRSGKYRRWRVDIDGFEDLPAYTYLLSTGEDEGAVPDEEYRETILTGMDDWGFSAKAREFRRRCSDSGRQPFRNYSDAVSVVAEPGARSVFGELREFRERGDCDAFVGFFYGIFTSAGTRAAYDLGIEYCKARLMNMRRCDGMPASTEYAAGNSVSGVLAVVPRGSISALDEVEGAPDWYRREEVPVDVEADGGPERCLEPAQYYQMNVRDVLRQQVPSCA